jgi:hypothetical protein
MDVLRERSDGALDEAFDLTPAIDAASLWTDRALDHAREVRARL